MVKSRISLIDMAGKEILYTLSDGEKRTSTPLAKDVEKKTGISFTTVAKRYEPLEKEGLIEEEYRGASILLSITDKGKQVVGHLKAIDEIMDDDRKK